LYILDTDHFSLLIRNLPQIASRITWYPQEEVATTIITAEEQLRGRLSVIRQFSQTTKSQQLILAYARLNEALNELKKLTVLGFTPEAQRCYADLMRQRIRVGTRDLRIAAIALSINATVVTRNSQDFSKVPGLSHEDWTSFPS
jgi:tRNA(fMet)-specific endonuclease VapC